MKSIPYSFYSVLLIPLTEILKFLASHHPEWVENFYSTGIYPYLVMITSAFSRFFPFSLMELLLTGLVLYALFLVIQTLLSIRKNTFKKAALRMMKQFVVFFSIFYFLFVILWSLNNYRLDVAEVFNLEVIENGSQNELIELYDHLIVKANTLHQQVDEKNINGNEYTIDQIIETAQDNYTLLKKKYPIIMGGSFSPAKPLFLSFLQTKAGYTGVYFPFTAEPNFNKEAPIFTIPLTVSHEMAHQRGFAQEDAANYVGFLSCKNSSDVFFQYSGYYFALVSVRNAIARISPQLLAESDKKLSAEIKADMHADYEFWTQHENDHFSEIIDHANDSYLKSNNQKDGILNYSKVVQLLIADYEKDGEI